MILLLRLDWMMSLIRFLHPDNKLTRACVVSPSLYITQTSRSRSRRLFVRKLFEVLYFSHNVISSKAEQTRQQGIFPGRQDVKTWLTSLLLCQISERKIVTKISFLKMTRLCYLTLSSATARIKGKPI